MPRKFRSRELTEEEKTEAEKALAEFRRRTGDSPIPPSPISSPLSSNGAAFNWGAASPLPISNPTRKAPAPQKS